MYFNSIDKACLYSTLIKRIYYVGFFSMYDSNLNIKNIKFDYICDEEFLTKCLYVSGTYTKGKRLTISIDCLGDTFKSLLKLYNYNFLLAFKSYLGDEKLDKLYKVG